MLPLPLPPPPFPALNPPPLLSPLDQDEIEKLKKELMAAHGDASAQPTANAAQAAGGGGGNSDELAELQARLEEFTRWKDGEGHAHDEHDDDHHIEAHPHHETYPRLSVLNKDSMLSHYMVVPLDAFPFIIGRSAREVDTDAAATSPATAATSPRLLSPSGSMADLFAGTAVRSPSLRNTTHADCNRLNARPMIGRRF